MDLKHRYLVATSHLSMLPPREALSIFHEAKSAATNPHVEAMTVDLQEIPGVGRQTALDILFALSLWLNGDKTDAR